MHTSKQSPESSIDSDLARDREGGDVLHGSDACASERTHDSADERLDADSLIGGSAVVSGHGAGGRQLRRLHSIYDDDDDDDDDNDNDDDDDEDQDEDQTDDDDDSDDDQSDKDSNDAHGSTVEHEVDGHQGKIPSASKSSHKIFTFSLPFGGRNLLPSSPLSSLKKTLLPGSSNGGDTDDKTPPSRKQAIKLKLQRQESITSVEEIQLFKHQKGIDNVRARAVKRAFTPGALFNTLRSLSLDHNTTTHDGYAVSRLESIWDELEGDVVVLGGYRGSILRDAETHKRVWIPIRAGFNIRKVDLLIGPRAEDEVATQKKIVPDGMLTHLGPVDVAKKLIKRLRNNPRVNVEDFGYDWRLALDITAGKLAEKLQERYDQQQVKKGVYVVAHSMGGLVAHKVLQERTHLIRGIIYVGSPSQCPNILGPLRFGDEVILNKSILSAEANLFMRSSLYFLPFDGRCFVNRKTFSRYDLDFFDPEVWKEYGLSPLVDKRRLEVEEATLVGDSGPATSDKFSLFSPVDMLRSPSSILGGGGNGGNGNGSGGGNGGANGGANGGGDDADDSLEFKTPYTECVEYLERELPRAKCFLQSLEHDDHKKYPPLAIVYGNKVPTVRGAKVGGPEEIKEGCYNDFYYGPGDGVVHHKWLLPERRGFPIVAKVASDCAHVSLMTDFEAMAKAFISIVDSEEK